MLWSSQSSRAHLLPVVFSYQHITVPHSQLQYCDIVFSHEICFRFRPHPARVADRRENICNKRENIWCMQRWAVVVYRSIGEAWCSVTAGPVYCSSPTLYYSKVWKWTPGHMDHNLVSSDLMPAECTTDKHYWGLRICSSKRALIRCLD